MRYHRPIIFQLKRKKAIFLSKEEGDFIEEEIKNLYVTVMTM
jgi:hypothetical protein